MKYEKECNRFFVGAISEALSSLKGYVPRILGGSDAGKPFLDLRKAKQFVAGVPPVIETVSRSAESEGPIALTQFYL